MRLYCPGLPDSGTIEIQTEEVFNYAKNVLRARSMSEVFLFDGKGKEARGVITRIANGRLAIELRDVFKSPGKESTLRIRLLQGVLKGQKMDLVVRKATELGVAELRPLVTEHTEVTWTRKMERWRKIGVEAARQCGRTVAPVIQESLNFRDYFKSDLPPVSEGGDVTKERGIIFWEKGGAGLKELFAKRFQGAGVQPVASVRPEGVECVSIAIGPEGGFSESEVSLAVDKGFCLASLGPRILRAETAAITAVGLVQFILGDMG